MSRKTKHRRKAVKKDKPSPKDHTRPSAPMGLVAFSFFWAIATLINTLPTLSTGEGGFFLWFGATCIAAVYLMLRPGSLVRLGVLAAFNAIAIYHKAPDYNNHTFIVFTLDLAIVTILLVHAFQSRKNKHIDRQRVWNTLGPVVALTIVFLYFWGFFHKLNTGFFDREISCAVVQLFRLHEREIFGIPLAFIPTAEWMQIGTIYGTVIIEVLIPLLLVFKRTRLAGVLTSGLFHFFLGFSYPAFSTIMYSMLIAFIPESFFDTMGSWWRASRLHRLVLRIAKPEQWRLIRRIVEYTLMVLCLLLVFMLHKILMPGSWDTKLRHGFWAIIGLVSLTVFLITLFKYIKAPRGSTAHNPIWPGWAFIIFPLLVIANGLNPYLGIKSTQSFAMYSNLWTEHGKSNHLIVPASWQIFDWEKDMVRVLRTSDPVLVYTTHHSWGGIPRNLQFKRFIIVPPEMMENTPAPTWSIPYITLRNRISFLADNGVTKIAVEYVRNGETILVRNAEDDPELSQVPYFVKKFVLTRAVPDLDKNCCMW